MPVNERSDEEARNVSKNRQEESAFDVETVGMVLSYMC